VTSRDERRETENGDGISSCPPRPELLAPHPLLETIKRANSCIVPLLHGPHIGIHTLSIHHPTDPGACGAAPSPPFVPRPILSRVPLHPTWTAIFSSPSSHAGQRLFLLRAAPLSLPPRFPSRTQHKRAHDMPPNTVQLRLLIRPSRPPTTRPPHPCTYRLSSMGPPYPSMQLHSSAALVVVSSLSSTIRV